MADTPSAHPEPAELDETRGPTTLPDFTPVPRARERSNGWKPQVQRAFIEALADTGSVREACRIVRRSDNGAYQLRRHSEAAEFAAAWKAALELGVQRVEDGAMHRAVHGTEVPVLSAGKQFGTRTVHNERLVMFILRSRRPKKYAEGRARALSALDKAELERLKQQWHQEWLAQDQEDEQETLASIDRFLDNMRTNRTKNMTARTRAAWEEYQRIEAEEKERGMEAYLEEDERARDADEQEPPLLPAPEKAQPAGAPDADPEPRPGGYRVRSITDDGW